MPEWCVYSAVSSRLLLSGVRQLKNKYVMKIEILEDVLEELANKLGVYGCCNPAENEENCDSENGFCCRTGFMMTYEDRIRQAIENEKKLEESGL